MSNDFKNDWKSDPKLKIQTERILSMPVIDRLIQLEEEANFFSKIKQIN